MAISIKHAKLSTELGVGEKFDDSEWDAEHDTTGIPDLAGANTFTANQTISKTGDASQTVIGTTRASYFLEDSGAGSNLKWGEVRIDGGRCRSSC